MPFFERGKGFNKAKRFSQDVKTGILCIISFPSVSIGYLSKNKPR